MNLVVTFFADENQYGDENINREEFKHLTWSPYDRVIFKEVNSFNALCEDDYMPESGSATGSEDGGRFAWNGIKQCMHLMEEYSYSKATWITPPSNEQYVFETKDKKYTFYCIYAMRFSEIIQRLLYKETIFDKKPVREGVFNCIKTECDEKESIDFKCFRSLGCEDMVVIFLADSLSDIISVVDSINSTTIKFPAEIKVSEGEFNNVFSSICVFSGLNDQAFEGLTDVDMTVSLNLKRNNPSEVINKIDCHVNGSYDHYSIFRGVSSIDLVIPKGKISFKEFHHDTGIFNGSSDFYHQNIHSSRTFFVVPEKSHDSTVHNIDLTHIYELSLRKNDDKFGQETRSNSPVASFIFGEYRRLISSHRVIQWRPILRAQFLATKSFAEYYDLVDKFAECKLLDYMQSSLHLINQACSPISEMPNHNHFYSGSFHDLLKAYYGIIDMLFSIGYQLPHGEKTIQDPITFAICLNATARINSEMFTRTDRKNRLVVFFLPYDTFWNYSDNIKKLVHEVFHYIAPFDRGLRANRLVDIIYSMLVRSIISKACGNIPKQKRDNIVPDVQNWYKFVIEIYNDKTRKKSLYDKLRKNFSEFFLLSAPEWSHRFIGRREVERVIYVTTNQVMEDLKNSFDKAMKFVEKNKPAETMSINNKSILKSILSEIDKSFAGTNKDEFNALISETNFVPEIRIYMNAAKEAFCDLWAIRITGMSIPEFVVFILQTMQEYYPKQIIINSLSKNAYNETKITFNSLIYRIILLIHKHLNEIGQDIDIKNNSFKRLFRWVYRDSSEVGKYIVSCIRIIEKKYAEFVNLLGKYEIDKLSEIAFYMVDRIYEDFEKVNCKKYADILRHISTRDLSNNISIEDIDTLCNFIGCQKYNPNCSGYDASVPAVQNQYNDYHSYQWLISNTGELMDSIRAISNIVSAGSGKRHILWYRGVCSDKYDLLPSIFRNGDLKLSIYANQAQIMKNAYFHSPDAVDVWSMPIEQRTALLQHYGIPTNLLDFSLNPLVALHFSITPDKTSDRENVNNGEFQPVIYVFDPIAYNRAVMRMSEGKPDLPVQDTISAVTFDINRNEEERSRYFVGDMSYDYIYEHNNKHTEIYKPSKRKDFFPAPIVIQQSNPRMVTQSGTFVAYSLHARPQTQEPFGRYSYLDLLKIQQRYLEFQNCSTNLTDRFIFPIFIQKNFVSELREQLKYLNIKTKTFYPELNRIFEDAMSDMI